VKYGKWIDWKNDGILPSGVELEGKYKVSFSPSTLHERVRYKKTI